MVPAAPALAALIARSFSRASYKAFMGLISRDTAGALGQN
jgi:hypothetical protein